MEELIEPDTTKRNPNFIYKDEEPKKLWDVLCNDSFKQARWFALFEAVNMIADKAEERGIPFDKVELKPLAIEKYIEAAASNIQRKILAQEYNIHVEYTDPDEMDAIA